MAINLSNILQQAQRNMRNPNAGPKRSGVGGSTTDYAPNTGTVVTPNPTSSTLPAGASIGEASRFLYDTRLQNVFNDYQQQVESLNQAEQKQLQDAFFIRELSKKYLGEYASNVGMGDVSGNLLDIYGAYQQNVTAIQQQSEQLKLGLQQSYDQQSRAAFEGAIEAQLQAEQMQLDENARTTLFNITQGRMGDMEWDDYLQSQLSSGAITEQSYQVLYTQVYQAKLAEVEANLERNFYGFKTDATTGERVMMTKEEYIESNKGWLNASDLQKLRDYALIDTTGQLTLEAIAKPEWYDTYGLGGAGFSFKITDEDGNEVIYAVAPTSVDEDTTATLQVSSEDLIDAFEEEYPNTPLVSGQTTYEYKGNYYYYVDDPLKGGTWYRAINYTATATLFKQMGKWQNQETWDSSAVSGSKMTTSFFTYDLNANELTLNNQAKTKLVYDTDYVSSGVKVTSVDKNSTGTKNQEAFRIFQAFYNTHIRTRNLTEEQRTSGVIPDSIYMWDGTEKLSNSIMESLKNTVIFFEGSFYTIDFQGNLRKFKKA